MLPELPRVVLTLVVAGVGGILFSRWKVPGGAIIGALIAVALSNIAGEMLTSHQLAYIPAPLRIFIQMFAGMRIGSTISKKDILNLRRMIAPAGILIAGMIVLNLSLGILMSVAGGLDLATALFACSPGGMSDMIVIADEMGANTVLVVVLHLSRVLFIFTALPPVMRHMQKKEEKRQVVNVGASDNDAEEIRIQKSGDVDINVNLTFRQKTVHFFVTAFIGLGLGFLFWYIGIKAGALLGAMVGVAFLNTLTGYVFFPRWLNLPLRVVTGGYVGQQVNLASLALMTSLGVPILIIWLGVILYAFVIPRIVVRFSKFNLITAMLSSTPGGMSEMSLMAEDMGADVPKVALLQTARQVVIISVFPTMLSAVTTLLT